MKPPLVSVVIPTAGRPELLARAIASCLTHDGEGSTEVLVIPNGPDESWRSAVARWAGDSRVRVIPIAPANQNLARNQGLGAAKGELIRFLDDDDYLIPAAAAAQYKLMQEHGLDASSGFAEVRDADGALTGQLLVPDTPDFLASVLRHDRLQLPFVHVYRRRSLDGAAWPPDIRRSEDIVFLIRYACAAPRKWAVFPQPVGIWYQHAAPRMSLDRPNSAVHETTARELIDARETLCASGRYSAAYGRIISQSLWQLVHRSFFLRPVYWTRMATLASSIDPAVRPDSALFRIRLVRQFNPTLLHWMALPLLWAKHAYRMAKAVAIGRDYRRTL